MRRPERADSFAPRPALQSSSADTIAASDNLRYAADTEPGICRRRAGSGFFYVLPNGKRVRDPATLDRIRKLAIPPAYRDVWVCLDPCGHLQATGIDARGRKQYRYHQQWRLIRDAHKFARMLEFGKALPRLHRRLARDLKLPGMPREKVLATIVRLLETTLIRIGNVEYARTNHSYGLTTLRNRHVKLKGNVLKFRFTGKHGIRHEIEIEDPRAAKVVRGCLELPGQDLFEYVDEAGVVHDVGSSDVNQYLSEVSGEGFTAKDFRTWHATSDALEALTGHEFKTASEAKARLKEVLQALAKQLGNTPAMCRKCYINPVVVDAFLAGELRRSKLPGGGDARVQLLQLLACSPKGAVPDGALMKPRTRKVAQRSQAKSRISQSSPTQR